MSDPVWYRIFVAIKSALETHATLQAIYGANIRKAGIGDFGVPLLEYFNITDNIVEQFAPHTLQFNQWTDTIEQLRDSEAALFELFEQSAPIFLAGIYMSIAYSDGADLVGPDRSNFFGRAVRFNFEPLSAEYVV